MATTSNSSATTSLATTPATTPTAMITAASTAKRLGYNNTSTPSITSSVICEEVFDDACLPSSEEISDYAHLIGIESSKEPHLLYLAKEGLMAALPPEWKICYSEEKSGHYYHNTRTKQSQWDHPLDAVYRELVEQTRQKLLVAGAAAATPIIDNSDDVSQLDSGIRSMQGNDELLDDMSSPLNNAGNPSQIKSHIHSNPTTTASTTTAFPGPSGFSGGVSRFLESRGKSFGPIFQPVKNTRFEVAKTNSQISLAMKQGQNMEPTLEQRKGAFQLSGTGAMFLKSRRQLEQQLPPTGGGDSPSGVGGVKGILRDSSLTDMRRRFERDEEPTEDKKSVRFNLVSSQRRRSSPDLEEIIRKSPELSNNSDDEEEQQLVPQNAIELAHDVEPGAEADVDEEEDEQDEQDDDEDEIWDEDALDPDAMVGICRLNPFISDAQRQPIRIISLPKAQTIQMMKAGVGSELDKLKDAASVKPLYEDTDSDSKGSSVRSFIINKSEQDSLQHNTFDLEELGRKHSVELEQLQRKSAQAQSDKLGMRSLKMASKLVGLLKSKDADEAAMQQLQQDMDLLKREHEQRLKSLRHEYDLRLTSHQHQLEEAFELQLVEYRDQLEHQLQTKRAQVVTEHKNRMSTLQSNHAELLHEMERDLRSEQELLRREHVAQLNQLKDKLQHELELEKQRLRDNGEERLYEKLRCEKRLLEDKYRCLKEKYVRLKTDVKLSLERRSRRREAQAQLQHHHHHHHTNTTTGSETERSISQKPSIGNSENRSLSYSEQATAGPSQLKLKPPVPPKTHLSKPGIASKYLKQLQLQDDTNTSLSQSDTTISNNYSKGRYLTPPTPTPTNSAVAVLLSDNGNSDSELALNQENNNNNKSLPRKKLFSRTKSASTSRLNSDNSNNYKLERPCTPVENLRHQLQKLEDLEDQFPEHTLETTYHLRYPFTDISNEHASVVGSELEFFKHRIHLERDSVRRAKESLRTQRTSFRARQREIKQRHKSIALAANRTTLDQLIQEEKELTEMEVNLHRTRALLGEKVIRLRHLEQSLLRIYEKEQPRLEQEQQQQHKDDATTLSDLSSHSSSGFSSTDFASGADLHKRKEYFQQESNECIQNLEILNAEIREILDILGQKQLHQTSPSTLPLSLPMPMISPNELSWSHMLSQQQSCNNSVAAAAAAAAAPLQQQQSSSSTHSSSAAAVLHAPHSIPTLADRLETYRQLAAGRMHSSMGGAILAANTIVSQSPRAVNYTTSLVERTRDLRNWLRQAKTEHELLTGMGVQHGLSLHSSTVQPLVGGGLGGIGATVAGHGSGAASLGVAAAAAAVGGAAVTPGGSTAQTNL